MEPKQPTPDRPDHNAELARRADGSEPDQDWQERLVPPVRGNETKQAGMPEPEPPNEGRQVDGPPSRSGGWKEWCFRNLLNFYPPFLGAGIKITKIADDYTSFDVRMKLTPLNRNYVGTHYGGSLYSMCDPFFMLILLKNMGKDHIVWDKAASIQFKKPGRGTVHAHFEVSRERMEEIRNRASREGKIEETFSVNVVDGSGEIVAQVEKLIHIRRKDARKPKS